MEELTNLLHRAYADLAQMGLRYTATHQDVATTRSRVAGGECFVLVDGARLVGTIVLRPSVGAASKVAWYQRPEVATFGQFGVDPAYQRRGLGRCLLDHVQRQARELGARELALDTSDRAAHLIALYERWGFRIVDEVQWAETNYRSVVMSRPISLKDD